MSRRGHCYDNSFVERFFKTLKTELPRLVFSSVEEARQAVFECIESWYNSRPIHSSLDYLSPVENERTLLAS